MSRSIPPILRRDDLDRMRQAEAVLRDAEALSHDTRAAAEAHARDLLAEAQRKAMRDSARTAARLIAQAEDTARQRIEALEPELARLVALTVRRIVGELAPEDATRAAALTALRELREHRRGRIFAAPDIAVPIEAAARDVGADGPEIVSVHSDPALDPGRALLVSDRGSTEIGLAALTEQALRSWTNAAGPEASRDATE